MDKLAHDQALREMKEKHRMQQQTTLSCIEMFLQNRQQCGVAKDEEFIKWLTGKLAEDRKKGDKLFREFERQFPD